MISGRVVVEWEKGVGDRDNIRLSSAGIRSAASVGKAFIRAAKLEAAERKGSTGACPSIELLFRVSGCSVLLPLSLLLLYGFHVVA
jgi:hypothetical protein